MAPSGQSKFAIELLAAAEAEFAQRGVEATRIDDIVVRAGRSKGAFYQYFNGKEDIFRHSSKACWRGSATLVATPLVTDEKHPPTQERFLELWLKRDEAIFEFIWANRDWCASSCAAATRRPSAI